VAVDMMSIADCSSRPGAQLITPPAPYVKVNREGSYLTNLKY
jgi:hypothetical protein